METVAKAMSKTWWSSKPVRFDSVDVDDLTSLFGGAKVRQPGAKVRRSSGKVERDLLSYANNLFGDAVAPPAGPSAPEAASSSSRCARKGSEFHAFAAPFNARLFAQAGHACRWGHARG